MNSLLSFVPLQFVWNIIFEHCRVVDTCRRSRAFSCAVTHALAGNSTLIWPDFDAVKDVCGHVGKESHVRHCMFLVYNVISARAFTCSTHQLVSCSLGCDNQGRTSVSWTRVARSGTLKDCCSALRNRLQFKSGFFWCTRFRFGSGTFSMDM